MGLCIFIERISFFFFFRAFFFFFYNIYFAKKKKRKLSTASKASSLLVFCLSFFFFRCYIVGFQGSGFFSLIRCCMAYRYLYRREEFL